MNLILLIFSALFLTVSSRTAEEWRTRTIYQILTDRFARSDGITPECPDLLNYCGGTFKGIENNLDYIQGMGFDAIWISPVMENGEGGYHGYWATNFYEINPHFGTKQDFHDLVKACHDRDIWIMVDTVPNHVSPVPSENGKHDFSGIYPFNDASHYHFPILPCKEVFDHDPDNQTALQYCWLWKLPDLNHENPYVAQTLLDWVKDFVETYHIDGLRVDAVKHVPLWFWSKFSKAAGVFTIGEVWHHDAKYVANYQNYMDSLLNYPLHGVLAQAFTDGMSMSRLKKYYDTNVTDWKDSTVLGNFVGNHDLSRYLSRKPDMATFKVFYAYILSCTGIPMVYYGDEQCFNGGDDPENREPLWGKMNTDSEMYQFFKTIIEFKKKSQFHNHEQIERFSDDSFYAFSRGEIFFAFTNIDDMQTRTIINHPYEEGGYLCDIFNLKDCVQVRNGEFQITLIGKQPKFLTPQPNPESESLRNRAWKNLKKIWSSLFTSDMAKIPSFSKPDMKR